MGRGRGGESGGRDRSIERNGGEVMGKESEGRDGQETEYEEIQMKRERREN